MTLCHNVVSLCFPLQPDFTSTPSLFLVFFFFLSYPLLSLSSSVSSMCYPHRCSASTLHLHLVTLLVLFVSKSSLCTLCFLNLAVLLSLPVLHLCCIKEMKECSFLKWEVSHLNLIITSCICRNWPFMVDNYIKILHLGELYRSWTDLLR